MKLSQPGAIRQPLHFDLKAFHRGDADAFRLVHAYLSEELSRFIRNFLLIREDEQDILASTVMKLYRRRNQMQSFEHIRRSMFLMAKNEGIDYRTHRIKRIGTQRELHYLCPAGEDLQEQEINERRTKLLTQIWTAAGRLSPQQHEVLKMYYHSGLTTAQVAAVMGLSPQTVLNHKNRALKAVRFQLAAARMPPNARLHKN